MDPITQGAFGAGWAQSAANKRTIYSAAVVGTVSGMAPDLDVLIRSSTDPLLFLEYHRHFTHALAFIPIGALLCALALHRIMRAHLPFKATYLFAVLGFASHGVLDACTTYGTQLFWPFSSARIAWDIVAVIDPFFTVPVIALLILAVRRGRPLLAGAAVAWAVAYLALGVLQHGRAIAAVSELAASRDHSTSRVVALPVVGSLLLWRGIYETDSHFHIDAIRTAWRVTAFPGGRAVKLSRSTHLAWLRQRTQQAIDLDRFENFANGFLAVDEADSNRIFDLRFAAIPSDTDGLWWIELDRNAGDEQHVEFDTTTNIDPRRGIELLRMLF